MSYHTVEAIDCNGDLVTFMEYVILLGQDNRSLAGRLVHFHLVGRISLWSCKQCDTWVWKFNFNAQFTCNSLSSMLDELSAVAHNNTEPTIINKLIPQKIGIFMWRAIKNKLPVRSELDKRGIDLHSTRCPVCDEDIESLQHILLKCKVASEVWELIRKWWNFDMIRFVSIPELSKASSPSRSSSIDSFIWQAVVWVSSYLIWKNRNDHVFGNTTLSPPKIVSDIQSRCFEWINCRSKKVRLEWLLWITDPLHSIRNVQVKEGIG
ncbi:uncharacterized protein [Rutidosis leptorrhynchoides]|uniref:uncharacterized protein n=1 Tax=Rutidosis leptorrhynchoides TaxID=125765 RepID=UPI003A998351